MIESLVINKTVHDMNDIMEKGRKLDVHMAADGKKLIVIEPPLPSYYHTHSRKMYSKFVRSDPEMSRAVLAAHDIGMNSVKSNPDNQLIKYVLHLPPGLQVQMGYMNPWNNRRLLKGSIHTVNQVFTKAMTGADADQKYQMITVTYVIALKTDVAKVISSKKDAGIADEAMEFFKSMSIANDDDDDLWE